MALSNAQYDTIMHQYEEKQQQIREEMQSHLEHVYNSVPGYKELDESVSEISLDFARKLIDGTEKDPSKLKKLLAEVALKKKNLLKEASLPSNYLEPHYTCMDCKDTGYIGNEKCHCFEQKIIDLLYSESNLNILTENNNFTLLSEEYFEGENLTHFQAAVQKCWDFVENFNSLYQNMFFYGTVGTGKSFLSISTAKELLDRGYSVVYFSAQELFKKLSDNSFDYHNRDNLQSLNNTLYNSELLIIDDLGTELTNSFVISQLFSLLNERAIRHNPIIISSNLSLEDLQKRYSDRIFSRITSTYMLIKLSGQDIRLYKRSHNR